MNRLGKICDCVSPDYPPCEDREGCAEDEREKQRLAKIWARSVEGRTYIAKLTGRPLPTATIPELIERLKSVGHQSTREEFRELLLAAYDILHLTDLAVAREFQVASSTIQRWRLGVTSPHPVIRVQVLKWLCSRASEQRFRELVKSAGDPCVSVLAVEPTAAGLYPVTGTLTAYVTPPRSPEHVTVDFTIKIDYSGSDNK